MIGEAIVDAVLIVMTELPSLALQRTKVDAGDRCEQRRNTRDEEGCNGDAKVSG